MQYRTFGKTGLKVSALGFGGWAIGGNSFGSVAREDALQALARAEELGCNLVDTAAVYGDSEEIIGQFLQGRRERWVLASKYSGQPQGMTALVDEQLRRLRTDHIDFYQIHWAPHRDKHALYDELDALKKAGKVRFVGVSLYNEADIDYILNHTQVDGFQVCFSLLDPRPLISRREAIAQRGLGVIVRSCLKEGFLTGKYSASSVFSDPADQRHQWGAEKIAQTAAAVERFRFLENEAGSLLNAAVRYPLSFSEVSTVVLSTKTAAQAAQNFGAVGGDVLSEASLAKVADIQDELGLLRDSLRSRVMGRVKRLLGR